jgi:hypothetical protein
MVGGEKIFRAIAKTRSGHETVDAPRISSFKITTYVHYTCYYIIVRGSFVLIFEYYTKL